MTKSIPLVAMVFLSMPVVSGSWFDLETVKAVLLHANGVGVKTSMTQELVETTALEFFELMYSASSQKFAQFAPLVSDHAGKDDVVAKALVNEAVDFVNRLTCRIISKGMLDIAFIG